MSLERTNEGQAERQEDLRQVQGDPPPRAGHGDLREPAAQAAPGLTAGLADASALRHLSSARPPRRPISGSDRSGTPPPDGGRGPGFPGPALPHTSAEQGKAEPWHA